MNQNRVILEYALLRPTGAPPWPSPNLFRTAVDMHNFEIFKFPREDVNPPCPWHASVVRAAGETGQWHIVRYCLKDEKFPMLDDEKSRLRRLINDMRLKLMAIKGWKKPNWHIRAQEQQQAQAPDKAQPAQATSYPHGGPRARPGPPMRYPQRAQHLIEEFVGFVPPGDSADQAFEWDRLRNELQEIIRRLRDE